MRHRASTCEGQNITDRSPARQAPRRADELDTHTLITGLAPPPIPKHVKKLLFHHVEFAREPDAGNVRRSRSDNSFVDLRSTDPDTVIIPMMARKYLQELALRRADRLRRNQPTLHMGDRPVNKDTLPSMIQDPRVLEACLKTLAIGVFDRQEAEKLAQLVHILLQERQELQKDRITLKESQDRRQLRINNLMTELREKKQECLDYRQTMVAQSQVHKAATDQQTSTTPETTAELPVRSPRAETPVARPHVPDQEGGVPTKPRKKLLPDPEVLTDGKKPDYDTWEIKMRAKLRHESFQYNTEELCIDYIFSRCSGRAADILAVGLEPGLYMIATSEEAFETLSAQSEIVIVRNAPVSTSWPFNSRKVETITLSSPTSCTWPSEPVSRKTGSSRNSP